MVFGVVLTLAVFWSLADLVFASRADLLRLLVLCSGLVLLLPFRWTGRRLGMERLEWVLFHVLGIGPFLFAGILGINFLLHDAPVCSTHAILGSARSAWYHRLELADGAFAEPPGVRRFEVEKIGRPWPDSLRICTARGVLGLEVVVERSLIGPDR